MRNTAYPRHPRGRKARLPRPDRTQHRGAHRDLVLADSCVRFGALMAILADFWRRIQPPGYDPKPEANRRAELKRQARCLRDAEAQVEVTGGFTGPIRPAQREASATIDRAVVELDRV